MVTCDTDNSATSNQHDVANPPGRLVRIRYATPFMVALDWLMIALYFALLTGLTWWSVARGMLLCAPIAAVFFFGVYMRRLTAAGCLAALIIGFALGLIRLAVDTPVTLEATRRSWNRVDTFSLRCGAGAGVDCRGLSLFQRLM